ncbi:biotin/lipoyl-containing protein, partial [Streptosporangium fragile]|uniref:biotin/lipoyl-containing protein n=1 Tax=Streptosporangium fragile TaxID=46186 RepID=UPI0031E69A20
MKEFKLPDVGEGLTEAEIVRWHVKPGDPVTVNQIIVEIETAKAVVELPCPFEGVVTALMAGEGETVDVGTPIISVDDGTGAGPGSGPSGAASAPPPVPVESAEAAGAPADDMVPVAAPREERQPVLVGYGVRTGPARRRPRKPSPTAAPLAGASAGTPAGPSGPVGAPTPGAGASAPGAPGAVA